MKAGRAKHSKRLVIDADIAHAAGDKDAKSPVSRSCRGFLENVRDICHRVVMTRAIEDEWNRHKSRFSSKWLRSMYARKKVDDVRERENTDLREAIQCAPISQKRRSEILRDVHLIEAARSTDCVTVSLNDEERIAFSGLAAARQDLRKVVWVNPAKEPETVIAEWLRKGAKPEKKRMLGYLAKPS